MISRAVHVASLLLIPASMLVIAALAHSQEPPAAAPAGQAPEKTEVPIPELATLEPLVGVWKVTEEHFDPATGKSTALVEGREEITWMLDRHAVQRRYATGTEKSTYRAEGVLTFSTITRKYVGTWYDNVSTVGPKLVSTEWRPEKRTMVHTIDVPAAGGTERFEVVERLVDEMTREAVTYRIAGDRVSKLLDVRYKRVSACPSSASFRRFFGS